MKLLLLAFSTLFLTANTCNKKQEAIQQTQVLKDSVVTTKGVQQQDAKPQPTQMTEITNSIETIAETSVKDASTQNQEKGLVAQYEAISRSSFLKVNYANGKVIVFNNRNDESKGNTVTLSKVQNEELEKMLQKIKPESLETMQAPSGARLYDGAAHANLSIISMGKTYSCPGFDHGQPPAGIEKFVKKLLSYTEKH